MMLLLTRTHVIRNGIIPTYSTLLINSIHASIVSYGIMIILSRHGNKGMQAGLETIDPAKYPEQQPSMETSHQRYDFENF